MLEQLHYKLLSAHCGLCQFLSIAGRSVPAFLSVLQCNDAYLALVVATELAKALNTDVNSLPLSFDISWFEQKAIAVLLTLLSLGVKNIRLGPNLPAFLTSNATALLVEKFRIKGLIPSTLTWRLSTCWQATRHKHASICQAAALAQSAVPLFALSAAAGASRLTAAYKRVHSRLQRLSQHQPAAALNTILMFLCTYMFLPAHNEFCSVHVQ
eukprot:GHRR01028711.1.p1 GENE.GHRR01028711.1~~GHRR01028711.1.p1  ORF type:complete len:212 (+),score=48.81 GHRR01028711.1:776-1411(+)